MNIGLIQKLLSEQHIDGWLIYNCHRSNVIAERIFQLPDDIVQSRRFFYFIPAYGTPQKLVNRIEEHNLDMLPGEKTIYLSWQSLEEGLKKIMNGAHTIAMEFSPSNAIPSISYVDAGTVDLIRLMGKQVITSANLVQEFEATLTDDQIESHITAAKLLMQFIGNVLDELHTRLIKGGEVKEHSIHNFIVRRFEEHNLTYDMPPIVAVNANTANPHYVTNEDTSVVIHRDNLVLVELWAKLRRPDAIYADITWMIYTGDSIPDEYKNIFAISTHARDTAFNFIAGRFTQGIPVMGYEVDDEARTIIRNAGYSDNFIHRTGHSLGEDLHGYSANLDNLETHDDRQIIPRTCFSIEPGIYTNSFGIRTEINVIVLPDKTLECSTEEQKEITII
jgi:Xaa-Pro aminopeptidase